MPKKIYYCSSCGHKLEEDIEGHFIPCPTCLEKEEEKGYAKGYDDCMKDAIDVNKLIDVLTKAIENKSKDSIKINKQEEVELLKKRMDSIERAVSSIEKLCHLK